jgi:hypothetical protein
MKIIPKLVAAAAVSTLLLAASPALAQPPAAAGGRAIVSIYYAAPGQQEALMRWLADQDRAAVAAGVAKAQVYVHTDGDAWDFVTINPVTTEAQDKALDDAAKKLGLATGPRVGLELRKHITRHTDTFVNGPMTAEQYLASLGPAK